MRRPRTSAAFLTLAAFMTVALLASPTGVSAAQRPETHVQYRSSDLATDRGGRALYWRIVFAARLVCPPEDLRKLWQLAIPRQSDAQPTCTLCLYQPDNMAFDAHGNIYLVDTDHKHRSRILKLSAVGKELADWRVFTEVRGWITDPMESPLTKRAISTRLMAPRTEC